MLDRAQADAHTPLLDGSPALADNPTGTPSEVDPAAACLDPQVISQLRELGAEEYRQLLDMFRDEATGRLTALRAALRQDDPSALQRIAHSLKGSSLSFGATVLATRCAEIEATASTGDTSRLATLVDDVAAELERVRLALREAL